jgi:hypothetical protein
MEEAREVRGVEYPVEEFAVAGAALSFVEAHAVA